MGYYSEESVLHLKYFQDFAGSMRGIVGGHLLCFDEEGTPEIDGNYGSSAVRWMASWQ